LATSRAARGRALEVQKGSPTFRRGVRAHAQEWPRHSDQPSREPGLRTHIQLVLSERKCWVLRVAGDKKRMVTVKRPSHLAQWSPVSPILGLVAHAFASGCSLRPSSAEIGEAINVELQQPLAAALPRPQKVSIASFRGHSILTRWWGGRRVGDGKEVSELCAGSLAPDSGGPQPC
jgi:hypothetical protein